MSLPILLGAVAGALALLALVKMFALAARASRERRLPSGWIRFNSDQGDGLGFQCPACRRMNGYATPPGVPVTCHYCGTRMTATAGTRRAVRQPTALPPPARPVPHH